MVSLLKMPEVLSLLLLLLLVPTTTAQVTMVATSFNNVGGIASFHGAKVSENTIVGKQGLEISEIVPNRGTQSGGR